MTVSATTPLDYYSQTPAATAAATDSAAAGRTRLAQNFDMFLTLLTTQLKNQDPTAPMDSNQFMSQLVEMTSVEQQLAGNDLLKQLVANTGTSLGSVVGLIGKEVRALTDAAALVNGTAKWGYDLPATATDVKFEILDSNGLVVQTLSADEAGRKAGEHELVWDGKDARGAKLPDGTYTLRITATDGGNKKIDAATFVQGLVTSIQQEYGQGLITVNGGKVLLSSVVQITDKAPAATTGGETPSTPQPSETDGAAATDPDTPHPADQTSA